MSKNGVLLWGQEMNKREFIEKLRISLSGKISSAQVSENINYYEDYINTQIRLGKAEEEVLRELGDPRLIARTIVQTSGTADETGRSSGEWESGSYSESGRYSSGEYRDAGSDASGADFTGRMHNLRLPGWAIRVITISLLLLIMYFVISVLSFLAPILLPLLFIVFLVKLFRDWLN